MGGVKRVEKDLYQKYLKTAYFGCFCPIIPIWMETIVVNHIETFLLIKLRTETIILLKFGRKNIVLLAK